jgi:biopolymer transport protein ExbB
MSDLISLLQSGGPVMIPIGVASVVALGVFLPRVIALRQSVVAPRGFTVELEELIKQSRYADALTLCKKADTPASRVAETAILARGRPREAIKERIEEVGRRESAALEAGSDVVGTIATIAPLLGLLGTVWGMILTFEVIASQGMGAIGDLAGGISQALITTLAGLTVAIPAVMGHRILLGQVDARILDLEDMSLRLLDLVAEGGEG